jgi:uncharacterized protein YegP (UPF0339 family)
VYRAYTSLFDAERGVENTAISSIDATLGNFDTWSNGKNLTTPKERWNIAMYGDAADTTAVTITGWTTNHSYYVRVFAPRLSTEVGESQMHTGKWDVSKARLAIAAGTALSVTQSNTVIDGIQFNATNLPEWFNFISLSATDIHFKNNYVWAASTNTNNRAVSSGTGVITLYIYNNIIRAQTWRALYFQGSASAYVYNNTIAQLASPGTSPTSIRNDAAAAVLLKNNISLWFGNAGSFSAESVNNLVPTNVPILIDPWDGDYRLNALDTLAKGQGADLSNDPYFKVKTDMFGTTRTIPWDIGATIAIDPPDRTIYRSIGHNSTAARANGAGNSMSIVGTTITFTNPLPDNVGVGDAVQYDSDGNASIDSIAFINGRTSSTVYSVQDSIGRTPKPVAATTSWNVFRAYHNLDAMDDASENTGINVNVRNFDGTGRHLSMRKEKMFVAVYADAEFNNFNTALDGRIEIDRMVTGTTASYYLRIYAPFLPTEVGVSQRHNGKWDSGGATFHANRNSWYNNVRILRSHTRLEGIRIYHNGNQSFNSDGVRMVETHYGATGVHIVSNYFKYMAPDDTSADYALPFGFVMGGSAGAEIGHVYNNIFEGFKREDINGFEGAAIRAVYGKINAYNNTFIDNHNAFWGYNNGCNILAKNNIFINTTVPFAVGAPCTLNAGTTNNVSSNASNAGSNQINNASVLFADFDGGDYRLLPTDTAAKSAGVDLSADPFFAFNVDIFDQTRTAPWDAGAFKALTNDVLVLSSIIASHQTTTSFRATVPFTGDVNANSSATLYYCNQTDTPACDPLLGASIAMTRGASSFTADVTGLSTPNDPGDTLKLRVVASDADGTAGAPKDGTATLFAAPTINIANTSVTEGGDLIYTVSLSGVSAYDVTFSWATADGTATTAGNDYTPASNTATITAGNTSINLPAIATTSDTDEEGNEYITVTLHTIANAVPGTLVGIGTIVDNDVTVELNINDISVTEGDNAVFTVSLSAPRAFDVTFDWATSNGTATAPGDYTAASGTGVTIPAGQTSVNLPAITTINDGVGESSEYFTVTLSNVVNAIPGDFTGQANLTDSTNGIVISSLTGGNETSTSFTATFNFTGDANTNATATLYYCNHTVSPGCNPLTGSSIAMSRSGATFTVNVTGLSGDGNVFNLLARAADADGVTGNDLTTTVTLGIGEYPAFSNLVFLYQMDEASGSLTDQSPNSFTAAANGAPVYGKLGVVGDSIQFGASNTRFSVSDPGASSKLDFDSGNSITVTGWIRHSASGGRYIVAKGGTNNNANMNWAIRSSSNPGHAIQFVYRNSGGTAWHVYQTTAANKVIPRDQWVHFAFTYTFGNGGTAKFYINGAESAGSWTTGDGNAAPFVSDDPLFVGANNENGGGGATQNLWDGAIDELSVWRVAMNSTQVANIYDAQRKIDTRIGTVATISERRPTSFKAQFEMVGDENNNSSAVMRYCNHTVSPGCNPELGGTATMFKRAGTYRIAIAGLTANPGDVLNLRFLVNDPDGVTGSVTDTTVTLDWPATMIYRSIGPDNTAPLAVGTTNGMTINGGVATFATALPDNVGVGDALVYASDASIVFIHGRNSSTQYVVRTATGGTPANVGASDTSWKLYRAYTSFTGGVQTGAENTGIPAGVRNFDTYTYGKNLVSANQILNLALYADDAETTGFDVESWTTDNDRFIRIFAPHLSSEVGVSQRHTGYFDPAKARIVKTNGYAVRLRSGATVEIDGLIVRGVNVDQSTPYNNVIGMSVSGSGQLKILNSYVDNTGTVTYPSGYSALIGANSWRSVTAYNNILINNGLNYGAIGLNTQSGHLIYNNTIISVGKPCVRQDTWSVASLLKNNIASCGGTNYASWGNSIFWPESANNISSDASSPNAAFRNLTATYIDSAWGDYRLSTADANAKGQGVNLTADSDLAFTTDINGITRSAPWDIGASVAVTPYPQVTDKFTKNSYSNSDSPSNDEYGCQVMSDNTVKCWNPVSGTPTAITGATSVASVISLGPIHVGLTSTGGLKSWWGTGASSDIAGYSNITTMAGAGFNCWVDFSNFCAVESGGKVKCHNGDFASASYMQNGGSDLTGVSSTAVSTYVGGGSGNARFFVMTDGTVRTAGEWSTATSVFSGLSNIVKVSAGSYHACALASGGGVKCWDQGWGANEYGQLGTGNTTASATPVDVIGVYKATDIAVTEGERSCNGAKYSTCASLANGRVMCWGQGYTSTPTMINGITDVTRLGRAGENMFIATKADGTTWHWAPGSTPTQKTGF